MKTPNTVSLALMLALVLTAAASAATSNLVLHLHDSQGHSFTYCAPVDATRYSNGSTPSPTELEGHLTSAKAKMANALGYTEALYGRDSYKMLGAVQVAGAWIEQGDTKEPLGWFRGEPERGE